MDPDVFADSDPDFKNKDPDPSVFCFNKLMGSKGCSLIRFWKNLTKKDTLDSVNMIYKYFLLECEQFLGFFFLHGSVSGFSGSDPDFWPIWIGNTGHFLSVLAEPLYSSQEKKR